MRAIVVTGGPCGGKTTALAHLKEELERRGLKPVLVPECATSLISSGIAPWTVGRVPFQHAVFELQLAEEDVFGRAALALGDDDVVVVLDRGLMDGCGYLTNEEFDVFLAEHSITREEALARYDAIFHLESTATGVYGAYTRENNASRFENVDEAVEVEQRILEAWKAHPRRVVIGNEEHFKDKCAHLLKEAVAFIEGA